MTNALHRRPAGYDEVNVRLDLLLDDLLRHYQDGDLIL